MKHSARIFCFVKEEKREKTCGNKEKGKGIKKKKRKRKRKKKENRYKGV